MVRKILFAALAGALAGASNAQMAPTPATSTLGGPTIAGVCLLSRQDVLNTSKVGKAVADRLRTLSEQAKAEIDADRAPLEPEVTKFNAEQAKLTELQRQERRTALADRVRPIQVKAQLRERELEATRAKIMARLVTEMEAPIAQLYKQRSCGLLVDRSAILGGNLSNDLTGPVTAALDAKIQTISFDRERLESAVTTPAGAN